MLKRIVIGASTRRVSVSEAWLCRKISKEFCSNSPNNNQFSKKMDFEVGKKAAAIKAIDSHVQSGNLVGIGSGSTIVYAVNRLAERIKDKTLQDIQCVPTSFQARQLILDNHLSLTSLEAHPRLDVAIDGADEADQDLTLIKGGGGCLALEKVVAENADLFVVIADDRKKSNRLGTAWNYVPIEVLQEAYKPLQKKIQVRSSTAAVHFALNLKNNSTICFRNNLEAKCI